MIQVHYMQTQPLLHGPAPSRPAQVPVRSLEVGAPALQASSGYCVGDRPAGTGEEAVEPIGRLVGWTGQSGERVRSGDPGPGGKARQTDWVLGETRGRWRGGSPGQATC